MAALCGKNVGASRRTSFPKEIAAWSEAHCPGAPINVVGTEGSADARVQLKQGRIDAAVQGNETLPYVMEQEPRAYATLGGPIALQFTGIALPVKETGLQQAVAGALDALIADGQRNREGDDRCRAVTTGRASRCGRRTWRRPRRSIRGRRLTMPRCSSRSTWMRKARGRPRTLATPNAW
jgi:hypothetical protein